ncbi:MAG: ABC-F family ATP-binding cassette domain-containing protein [Bacillota bacterium]
MIILSCNNITKSFGIDTILQGISFSVNQGEKVGLVGANGAGKTTLFKILTGQYGYDSGDFYLSKNITIGYLEQNTGLSLESTVIQETLHVFDALIQMENDLRRMEKEIADQSVEGTSSELDRLMEEYAKRSEEFQQKNGYGYMSEVRGVLRGLGFSPEEFEQPIYQLSGGQKTRISLAKLLLTKPDILLLDEPTNHLDMNATEWLESYLKTYNGTVLLISHDRYFLDEVVDKIFEIESTRLTVFHGNYSFYADKKKVYYEQQLKEYIEQQKEIEKQEEIIRRFKQHGTEKLAKRAKSREKRLEHVERIDKPVLFNKKVKIHFETRIKSGNDVIEVNNLTKSFDDQRLFDHVNFRIFKGERVGLIGPNGIGKSTLFKILLGLISYDEGNLKVGHNVHLGYYDQEQSGLNPDNTLIDEIWEENIYFSQTYVRTLLGSFLFMGEDVFKPISVLSGGEKSRLSLLKLILSKANFLLMDEPTNHLDIASKEVLEEALINYDGTLFIISHDRYFLNKVTTKIFEMSPEGIQEFLGNYRYYQEKKRELAEPEDESIGPQKTKTQLKDERKKEKEKQQEIRKLKKQREEIETQILLLEEQLRDLEHLMCQEEVYADPERSREIHMETVSLKEQLDLLYTQWEEYLE